MERDFEKDIIELDAAIKSNAERDNTFTLSVLQRAKEIILQQKEKLKAYEDTGLTPEEILGRKMLTGWIPVEERLPGTERVLITNGEFVKEGYRRPDGVWKYGVKEDELFSSLSSVPVIAWMPLPEPLNPQN